MIQLSNKPITETLDAEDFYYPILTSIAGVGSQNRNYVPTVNNGSFTIQNLPNSFGWQRRFSDLLERWSFQDEPVSIYVGTSEAADEVPDWTLVFRGQADSARDNKASGTFTINLQGRTIPTRVINKIIDPDTFPNAPISSLGQPLPIPFGLVDTVSSSSSTVYNENTVSRSIPLLVDQNYVATDSSTAPFWHRWAYATAFAPPHPTSTPVRCSSPGKRKVQDNEGNWVPVLTGTGATTPDVGSFAGPGGTYTDPLGANDIAINAGTVRAEKFAITAVPDPVLDGKLFYGGFIFVRRAASASQEGTFTIELWTEDLTNGGPGVQLGKAERDKQFIVLSTSGFGTRIYFHFDRHILLRGDRNYFFVYRESIGGTSALIYPTVYSASADVATDGAWLINSGESNWTNTSPSYVPKRMHFGLYAGIMTNDHNEDYDREGKAYSFFEHEYDPVASPLPLPDASLLRWLCTAQGLSWDIGSGSTRLDNPMEIADFFTREYDGTNFKNPILDSTAAQFASYTDLEVSGATSGKVQVNQLLEEIASNTSCKYFLDDEEVYYLGLWRFGSSPVPVAELTDENSKVVDIEHRSASSVVNSVDLINGYNIQDANAFRFSQGGVFQQFSANLKYPGTLLDPWIEKSLDLYGVRPLDSNIMRFAVGQLVTRKRAYITTAFCYPTIIVTLECPVNSIGTIKPQQIVQIKHPELMHYYGTSSDAPYPHVDGTEVDPNGGAYYKRAPRYRAQIEGRTLILDNSVPRWNLQLRLLLNYPNDPT